MYLIVVGLNHKTAPVEVREKLSFPEHTIPESLEKLKSIKAIRGCAILSTCNRTEVYGAVTDVEGGLNGIREFLAKRCRVQVSEIQNYLYNYTLFDVINHLFSVASGLDSMILGETQILGQVRTAYQMACECGATNGVLNTLFQRAVTVGKRVRTETDIDRNAVSISYAAVELAKQVFENSIQGKSVLIVGAGKMSELTAKHLVANGVTTVMVSNRSYDRAVCLAQIFGGKAVKFDELFNYMESADIIISATAATHCIIKPEDIAPVMSKRNQRKMFIIDIAVPRDVDPGVGEIEGVCLYDIDDLKNVVDSNLSQREKEARKAEKIIKDEIDEFWKWLSSQFATPTVAALKQRGEEIKQKEITRAFNRLGNLTDREKKVISSMANSIVNQLLHDPVVQLKHYALSHQGHLYTEILQKLFKLEVSGQRILDGQTGHPHADMPPGHPGSSHPHGGTPHFDKTEATEEVSCTKIDVK